jgi:uncharacterized protein YybS (DUF2232 family)
MQARRDRTRGLTEIAFLAALAAVLFFFAQIPVVGPILCLGCPVPVCLMVYRHGPRAGLTGAIAALVLVFLMQGALAVLTLPFLVVGALLGFLLRQRVPLLGALGWGGLVTGLLLFGLAWPYENLLAERWGTRSFRGAMESTLDDVLTRVVDPETGGLGIPGVSVPASAVSKVRKLVTYYVAAVAWMPLAVCLFLGFFGFWIHYLAARPVLERFQLEAPPVPDLQSWRAPFWLTWGVIALVLLRTIPGFDPDPVAGQIPYLRLFLMNVEVLVRSFFALMGVAVVDAFLIRLGLPWPLARIGELILVALPLPWGFRGFALLGLVGLLDPWTDPRGRAGLLPPVEEEEVPEDLGTSPGEPPPDSD